MGYAIAGVGAVTALIGTTLALGESEEGLHAVGLALGLLAAGFITDRLDRHIGTARVHVGALVLLALAVVALAWSPALVVTLLGMARRAVHVSHRPGADRSGSPEPTHRGDVRLNELTAPLSGRLVTRSPWHRHE